MSELSQVTELSEVPALSGVPALRDGEDPVETLRREVGRVVVGHPGVLRLEPTLLGAVRGLGQGTSLDGIQLAVRGRVVDLDLNIATRAEHQARASALELHRRLVDLAADHGFVVGSVEISVLAVEGPTPRPGGHLRPGGHPWHVSSFGG